MPTSTWLALFYAGLLLCRPAIAAETPTALEQEEVRECSKNLHLIYEAIQAYRRVNKDLPNELADLTPRFLSDVHLVCPAARRLGLTSTDLAGWGPLGRTGYTHEFSPRLIPPIISGGAPWSMRQWKQLQMGLIGSDVPIVRCLTHEQVDLNLSFGGRIFETKQLEWENNFTNVVNPRDLTFERRFAAYTIVKKLVVPARSSQALPSMLDLSTEYNRLLAEIWPSSDSPTSLPGLHSGVFEFNRSRFDLRGAIQLGALRPGLVQYPLGVTNILIELAGREVQLLLGTAYAAPLGTPVAECVFHLADGRRQRLRLLYGTHLAACIGRPDEPTAPMSNGKIVWSQTLGGGSIARLYQCAWINPAPDQRIESVDFLARSGNAGPILAALSVE